MQRLLSTSSHRRPLAALTAAAIAFGLLAGCAQTPLSPEQKKQALRTHIEQEKEPFWRTQQATLAKVMKQPPSGSYTLVWLDLNEAERKQVQGERPAQEWVCKMGAASMLAAIGQGTEPQKVGERVVIDTDGVTPGFVGDEARRQRQQAVMATQWQALVDQTR